MRWARHVARMVRRGTRVGWWESRREEGLEFGIEPSGSLKCWETIECPNN
jgi:hypothetical protein